MDIGFQVLPVVFEIFNDRPGNELLRGGHHVVRRHDLRQLRRPRHHHEPVVVYADGILQQGCPQLAQLTQIGIAIDQFIDLRFHLPTALKDVHERVQQRLGRSVHAQYATALSLHGNGGDTGVIAAPKSCGVLGAHHAYHFRGGQSLPGITPRASKAPFPRPAHDPAGKPRKVQLLGQHVQRRVQVLQFPFLHRQSLPFHYASIISSKMRNVKHQNTESVENNRVHSRIIDRKTRKCYYCQQIEASQTGARNA